MAQWQCIGWAQIWLKPKILLKSRPLIGRELGILASDWSRGLSENVQRGYPYDRKNLPLLCLLDLDSSQRVANPLLASLEVSAGLAEPPIVPVCRVIFEWQLSDS